MVNFEKLGERAGKTNYSKIDDDWHDLSEKKRSIIRALLRYPNHSQKEIADIAGVTPAHVHNVVYSLPFDQFQKYKSDIVEEASIKLTPGDEIGGDDDEDTITVTAPMQMWVSVSIPIKDLETATSAAMSQEEVIDVVEGKRAE